MASQDELMSQLREQGVDDVAKVRSCHLEGDGQFSVVGQRTRGRRRLREVAAADVIRRAILYELLRPPAVPGYNAPGDAGAGQGRRAGAALAIGAGIAARPRDDLPQVPTEGPGAAVRSAAALAEDLLVPGGGADLGAAVGSVERTCRWCRPNLGVAGSLSGSAPVLVAVAVLATLFAVKQAEARNESTDGFSS